MFVDGGQVKPYRCRVCGVLGTGKEVGKEEGGVSTGAAAGADISIKP